MSKKTKIFISVFIIVGILIFGVYYWLNSKKSLGSQSETPWYQNFNPFGTSQTVDPNTNPNQNNDQGQGGTENPSQSSRFFQITDFAVAGAMFLMDTRPIEKTGEVKETPPIQEVKTVISANTIEGRKEIQKILNEKLSLNPPLIVDGNFGKMTSVAISKFQKLNDLEETGKIGPKTAALFTKTTETSALPEIAQFEEVPSLRFVERMNGHMYKMFLDTKIKEKISNSTIPSIYESFFDKTGKTVIYRYLSSDKINSFIATLGAPNGEFLPQDVSDLSVSKDKTKFFYLVENSNGVTGMAGTFGETKKETVFDSPFTEWLSQWVDGQKIFLTTKASYGVDGSIFLLNTTNKTITKVFGGVVGLTTLVSPNGNFVLYSTSTKNGPSLGIFDINKHTTKNLSLYGLPEKCVWANDNINVYCAVPNTIVGNQFPDSWYQGLVSFDDYFVKINTYTNSKTTITNSTNETPVDGTHLFLSKTEDLLFFTNKKDSTLWSLKLK